MKRIISAILFSIGCAPIINPPIEERVFFPDEVLCKILWDKPIPDGMKCQLTVPSVGDLKEFLVVGQGAWIKDQELIDQCIERIPLLKKRAVQ
jgi:hypothetical protein